MNPNFLASFKYLRDFRFICEAQTWICTVHFAHGNFWKFSLSLEDFQPSLRPDSKIGLDQYINIDIADVLVEANFWIRSKRGLKVFHKMASWRTDEKTFIFTVGSCQNIMWGLRPCPNGIFKHRIIVLSSSRFFEKFDPCPNKTSFEKP